MAIKTYKDGTPFTGVIGRTTEESSPAWPEPPRPPEGAELQEVVSAQLSSEVTSSDDIKGEVETRPYQGVPATGAETERYPVRARSTRYIQFIDPEIMPTLAREKDLVIRLLRKPGHYVQSGAVVALVGPASRVDGQLDKLMRRAFQIGNGRTPTQDVEYAVNQLVETAFQTISKKPGSCL